MSYQFNIKLEAIQLRKHGFSLTEISERLKIAKSTASAWLYAVELSPIAQKRLEEKRILGQYKSILRKKQAREILKKVNEAKANVMLKKYQLPKEFLKLCCALVWWCEGNKTTTFIRFTSSDSSLIKNFLFLLRNSFELDESKFRGLIHLHNYHKDLVRKKFWADVTKIPLNQFNKSYQKANTGIRTKDGYPGCIAITYYDARIAKELEAIYNVFSKN